MTPQPTHFAPAERAEHKTLNEDYKLFWQNPEVRIIMDAIPFLGLILNENRQLVYSNKNLVETIGAKGIDILLGQRPGELLNCVNAKLEPGGCGTSEFCQVCGAARVILESLRTGKSAYGECRINSSNESGPIAWDFKCMATPFRTNNKTFTVLSLMDISHEKRRGALEKIFFHDLINTASGLDGFINIIQETDLPVDSFNHLQLVRRLSRQLLDEIIAQQQLYSAENGELHVRKESIYSLDLISDVVNFMAYHNSSFNKTIITEDVSDNSRFFSDPNLLRRVLINMLKNALEGCEPSEEVRIGCEKANGHIIFYVSNPGFIQIDTQKQIFQRSFSTKGPDRGLGTYSMRLLTEKYLGGKVSFYSSKESGTIFRISIPSE